VTAMGQDRQGFLWIGTQTGLYRYDGARAQKMTDVEGLIGHYVLDVVIAPDGTPWFAGNRGIAYYKDRRFESLSIPASAMALASESQIFAVDSKGVVYAVLFNHGVLRVDSHNPEKSTVLGEAEGIRETVAGIVRAQDDSIWFTYGTHLAHVQAGSNKVEVDPEIRIPKERVVALLCDGANGLWLRTATKLARVNPAAHRLTLENAAIGPADDVEGKPTLDLHGKLLVPSSTGLYWQGSDGKWRVISDKQGLSSNDIQFAMEDREGTMWVGGSGTGLDRLPGVHEWTGWTTAEGLPDNTTWATQRDHRGRLWVSTAKGIAVWEEERHQWMKVPLMDGKARAQVRQLQVAGDGAIWALTVTGALVRINPDDLTSAMHSSYRGRAFQTVYASPKGEIWATTRDHLVRFDTRNPNAEPKDVPLPLSSGVELFYVSFSPQGAVWVTGTGVVYRFDGKNWQALTMRDGLQGQAITSMAALSDKEAWVAYNDVVEVTRIGLDDRGRTIENFPWDWSIVGRDSHGRVWFDGPDGLAICGPNGELQRLGHADGLLWDDVSPWTGVREEKDGSYLIATSRGLARYRPQAEKPREDRLNVELTKVTLGEQERLPEETPKVKSADGSLVVQFSPMILGNPGRVSCQYELKGLEQQATETQQREVQYGGLPPGHYEFWVQCREASLALGSQPAMFRFEVLPNLWQTWWARVAGGFVLLGCFWGYVFMRTRALNRRRVELEQAVAQRSAELMQKNKELEEISLTDPLTGARNRRYFYETISKDIAQATRSHLKTPNSAESGPAAGQELIFVLVDIDRFKRVNDDLGHAAGDRLLQEVAKRIASVMRRSDDLVRWGGEEFMLVCRTTDRNNASLLCDRVLEAIREVPFNVGNGVEIHKTCSIGWAPFPWLKDDVGMLSMNNVIELADKALYLAKREGRNRSYGMVPAARVYASEKSVSIESLRDCPPDLVQIV